VPLPWSPWSGANWRRRFASHLGADVQYTLFGALETFAGDKRVSGYLLDFFHEGDILLRQKVTEKDYS